MSDIHFISAGAGSGKTYRLTELLFEKLSGREARPSGVIATTFTVRAATELRERVRSSLLQKGASGLANAMGQARIGTVHSVCSSLLERFAFEAGISPELRVMDEQHAEIFLKRAIDEAMHRGAYDQLTGLVRRLGLEWDPMTKEVTWQVHLRTLVDQTRANDIEPAMLKDMGRRNAKDLLSHLPRPSQRDLTAELKAAIDTALPRLTKGARERNQKGTAGYLDLLRDVQRGLRRGAMKWSDWVKLTKEGPEAGLAELAEPIQELAGLYARNKDLHKDIEQIITLMFDVTAGALEAYAAVKREQGVIDFGDQEHLALKVLNHPEVAATLSEELDLLLVDEFQDTSPIQLAIFLKLSQFAKQTYWVGDIKQAIYGFRGSDTELMGGVLDLLSKARRKPQILESSWRSRPGLVHLLNETFVPAFKSLLAPEQVELKPQRKELKGPVFGNWILKGKNLDIEYEALAGAIQDLVASGREIEEKDTKLLRPVRYADIAVLARTNDHVLKVAAALDRMNVPCATAQQPGLLAKPESVLALACLRRMSDPSDTIATAEILSLADCAEPEDWLADRLRYLAAGDKPGDWKEAGEGAHPVISKLAQMRASLQLLSPREALQQVIAQLDLARLIVQWNESPDIGQRRLANLQALIGKAGEYEDAARSLRQPATVSGFVLWLQDEAEDENDFLAEPAIDAVQVLTQHKSKGLEWPVVICTELDVDLRDRLWWVSAQSEKGIDPKKPLADRFLRYWPWPFGPQKKVELAEEISQTDTGKVFREAAEDEQRRLMYVAMTRARDLLILTRSSRYKGPKAFEILEAPWLISEDNAKHVKLPSGRKVPSTHEEYEQAEPKPRHRTGKALKWFKSVDPAPERLRKCVTASEAGEVKCTVAETIQISEGLKLERGTDPTELGSALHACIAASFTEWKDGFTVEQVRTLLSNLGMSRVLNAAAVHGQIEAFHKWVKERWPDAVVRAEAPVEHVLPTGQVMRGQIDLLIKARAGWVVVDHKSVRTHAGEWDKLSAEYGGQLRQYGTALDAAVKGVSVEHWLYSPLMGSGARLAIDRRV